MSASAGTHPGQPVLLPLSMIRRPAESFPRERVDPERVEEFATLYADGGLDALPPVLAVDDRNGAAIRADGETRLCALEQLGFDSARVVIEQARPGTAPIEHAYIRALELSARAPRALTRSERARAVDRLLAEHPDWSDRRIAGLAGVSHRTVGAHRERVGNCPPAAESGHARATSSGTQPADPPRLVRTLQTAFYRAVDGLADGDDTEQAGRSFGAWLDHEYEDAGDTLADFDDFVQAARTEVRARAAG